HWSGSSSVSNTQSKARQSSEIFCPPSLAIYILGMVHPFRHGNSDEPLDSWAWQLRFPLSFWTSLAFALGFDYLALGNLHQISQERCESAHSRIGVLYFGIALHSHTGAPVSSLYVNLRFTMRPKTAANRPASSSFRRL